MLNLPNILTLSRMVLLPIIVGLFFVGGVQALWWALVLYIVASLTDFIDGWVARTFDMVSEFGTFLDPISDKIFVGTLLVVLVGFGPLSGLWIVPVLLIFMREFLVSGLREFLGPKNVKMPVTNLAKYKTALQMLSLGFLIIGDYVPYAMEIGRGMLCVATALTLVTGWSYLKMGMGYMKN